MASPIDARPLASALARAIKEMDGAAWHAHDSDENGRQYRALRQEMHDLMARLGYETTGPSSARIRATK